MAKLTRYLNRNLTLALAGVAICTILLYLIARTTLFLFADYLWVEKAAASLLLLAELFIMVHALGYFLNVYHVNRGGGPRGGPRAAATTDGTPQSSAPRFIDEQAQAQLAEKEPPEVAIIVAAYREPLWLVEETLTCFYNLTYPNKRLFLLDDTRYDPADQRSPEMTEYRQALDEMCQRIGVHLFRRPWRGAKAGMINDFLAFLDGRPPEGFELRRSPLDDRPFDIKYVAVFDADMNPLPDFAEPLVAQMEAEPDLAFIQTPQYYSNFESNRVAHAAGMQQAIFYEYICEGKSSQDTMFCCGTNVLLRREALKDVGGFDESSVTEDFATSLRFHSRGWRSAYVNRICAFGQGPEDLSSYFKQQFRWALGTVGLFRRILQGLVRSPRQLSAAKWWEYTLSGSHYFVGWVFLILVLSPALYLLLGVPSFFARADIYLLFFFPYIVIALAVFTLVMSQRKYRLRDLVSGIVLQATAFPVYIKASLLGILGVRGTFTTTPKAGSHAAPLRALWPHLSLIALSIIAITWGIMRALFEQEPIWAILVNTLWCLYHLGILLAVFYFNNPAQEHTA
ncbi:cellulose synthase [Halorhodospira halochloris]|uniref:Cellulose synthase n=1 Tax=Halorhodospira halochloris TaxID=1052 RepID=A0A0X8X7M1_HALHR|nr:glycosyltransferase family 2 protein [Halorhodospira halochloris]MBK1651026.1 cellulose synthase [Halorhodospira halochloris]MCG5547368.1 glycosyltransferase [Halorhodospira halochloris]BAU56463.1 cellulose synthase [Halorhodospira halochloris]